MRNYQKFTLTAVALFISYSILNLFGRDVTPPKLTASNALELWNIQRSYPFESIPDVGYYDAFVEKQTGLLRKTSFNAPDSWESLGPFDRGGRTLALKLDPNDPNILYAGTASGGFWRMTITSAEPDDYLWERIETGFPVLGVNAIAIDPRDSDVIYIGTGEVYGYRWEDGQFMNIRIRGNYGIGLLKTTDGGLTWEKSIDWTQAQMKGILSLAMHPDNPDIVFAGTTEGLFRTSDAGANWSQVHSTVMTVDIEINPLTPETMIISCGNIGSPGNGLYRSNDGGTNWEKLSGGLPSYWEGKTVLEMYEASPNIIYADVADYAKIVGLYKSEDFGDTWELLYDKDMAYNSAQGYYSHFARVNPVDNNKVFKAKVIYGTSEDGGRNFKVDYDVPSYYDNEAIVAHPDHHDYVNIPDEPNSFYMATDGGVYRTENGGITFTEITNGFVTTQFYPGFSNSPIDPDFMIGGMQDNGVTITRGDGTWERWVVGGDGAYTAIDENNPDIIFGSSQFQYINRSMNGGVGWEEVGPMDDPNSGYPNENEYAAFIAPFSLTPAGVLFAATTHVYRSDDYGDNWTALNNGMALNGMPIVAMTVDRNDNRVIYAATTPDIWFARGGIRSEIFKTSDGGLSWVNITSNLPKRYITDIAISPQNKNVIYVTLSGFGTSHLYRSMDSGREWIAKDNDIPDIPAGAVFINPNDEKNIYLGNDIGVWVTTDDGYNWENFSHDLPDAVMVMDLVYSPANNKIRAATHGSGIFERTLLETKLIMNPPHLAFFSLFPNYPNPFNNNTVIPFSVSQQANVSLKIYSTTGQLVKTLINGSLGRGLHETRWDGTNNTGNPVASGAYIYRLKVNNRVDTGKLALLK